MVLQPHGCIATIVVWALPRSLATTRGIIVYFLFLEVLRCFSSLRLLSTLWQSGSLTAVGLSHSDICGSKIICIYPQLFAAYHVLHRLCEPRHPPCALTYFISWTLLPFAVGSLWNLPQGSCAHTLAVLIDCLEIVLYLAIEFSFVSFDSPCSISKECSLQFSLCQYVKDLLPKPYIIIRMATWRITDSNR